MARTPRFDAYQKLLFRMWEALGLLQELRPVLGPHTVTHFAPTSLAAKRRRFQRNLAFICDFRKGGNSATSIAIENRKDEKGFIFWVSSNQGIGNEVLTFLRETLSVISATHPGQTDALLPLIEVEQHIGQAAAVFSQQRVRSYASRLANFAKRCRIYIEHDLNQAYGNQIDFNNLSNWLLLVQAYRETDPYTACLRAYDRRRDPEVRLLDLLGQDPADGTNAGEIRLAFRAVRHLMGRLAAYIRVSRELVEDSFQLPSILYNYQVSPVDLPVPAAVPAADSQTNIECILKRMLTDRDIRFAEMLQTLQDINHIKPLDKVMYDKFSGQITPRVHCEVQMIEHFHQNGLAFAASDRYVASSKPSCVACKLYFYHHPARPVRPDSHEKVYCNWAPIHLPGGKNDPGYIEQRNLLNKMSPELRDASFQRLEHFVEQLLTHPDSLTMITEEDDAVEIGSGYETDATEASEASEDLQEDNFDTLEEEGGAHLG